MDLFDKSKYELKLIKSHVKKSQNCRPIHIFNRKYAIMKCH